MKITYTDKGKVESVSVCYTDHFSDKETAVSATEWLNGEGISVGIEHSNGVYQDIALTNSQITAMVACFELLGLHNTDDVDAIVKDVLEQQKKRTDTINRLRVKHGIKE